MSKRLPFANDRVILVTDDNDLISTGNYLDGNLKKKEPTLCLEYITPDAFENEKDPILLFTWFIQEIMEEIIPKTSGKGNILSKPW